MIRALVAIFVFAMPLTRAFSPYYVDDKPGKWDFNYTGYPANVFNPATKAIRFQIGAVTVTTANRTAELNAIRASFGQWQAISGTILKFEEGPLAPANVDVNLGPDNRGDGTNAIFWAKSEFVNNNRDSIAGRAGLTLVALEGDRILEADIALNGFGFQWFTDYNNTSAGGIFVEAIATHEIGHFLGLDHTPLGGASVIDGFEGVGPSTGLSTDEIAAARFLYPAANTPNQFGTIAGTVLMNGVGIHGAIVTAETSQGIAIAATPAINGNYKLPALPPGAYNVHVSPLDPGAALLERSLFRSQDIAFDFGAATTAFKPTENTAVTVTAGATTTLNFNVAAGEPPLRIQQISKPAQFESAATQYRAAIGLNPGDTRFVGVLSSTLSSDTVLSITGDGITVGPMIYKANAFLNGLNLLQASVAIANNATPGLRTMMVRRGADLAYANGYFEVFSTTPDINFDGLDDRFQRQYFPVFTAPEAAPTADPDADHFSNAFESLTATNPTDGASHSFLIERIDLLRGVARVIWKSDIGKQYQLYAKQDVAGATWQAIGPSITATSAQTIQSHSSANGPMFFKLKLLP